MLPDSCCLLLPTNHLFIPLHCSSSFGVYVRKEKKRALFSFFGGGGRGYRQGGRVFYPKKELDSVHFPGLWFALSWQTHFSCTQMIVTGSRLTKKSLLRRKLSSPPARIHYRLTVIAIVVPMKGYVIRRYSTSRHVTPCWRPHTAQRFMYTTLFGRVCKKRRESSESGKRSSFARHLCREERRRQANYICARTHDALSAARTTPRTWRRRPRWTGFESQDCVGQGKEMLLLLHFHKISPKIFGYPSSTPAVGTGLTT